MHLQIEFGECNFFALWFEGVALAGRPLALSTRDASRSFSLARPATAQGKRRASPNPYGLRGLTRKRCGTDRNVFLEGFHVGFRRYVYANLALLKDADFAVITSKFSLLIFRHIDLNSCITQSSFCLGSD